MCCDGSLFGRVPLEPDEVPRAQKLRLQVLPSTRGFEQPCTALRDDGCSIYDDRPRACRRFRCRLYERHEREGGAVEERIAIVQRVRTLATRLEASGLTPAELGDDEAYLELQQLLEEHFARAD
jgi:Fe-S-cluster containining protein